MAQKIFRIFMCLLAIYAGQIFAIGYTFTTGAGLSPNVAGFPGTPLTVDNADSFVTVDVQSGTMAATSGAFTIDVPSRATAFTVTVQSNATLSYAGSNLSANTVNATVDGNNSYIANITNDGTISRGTATNGNALFIDSRGFANSTLNNNSVIDGPVVLNGTFVININSTNAVQNNGGIAVTPYNVSTPATLNLGNSSAVNYTTGGTISGVGIIRLFAGTFTVNHAITGIDSSLTTAASSTLRLNAALSGTGTVNNSGAIFLNIANAIGTTGVFTNSGGLNVATSFTVPTGFINTTGGIYVIGTGSITGNLTAGSIFRVGVDSTGASNTCDFTTGGTIAGVAIVSVNNGSLTANHTISGVTTSFDVGSGTTATFNAQLSGAGCDVTNAGNLILNVANAINTTGGSNPFVNSATGNVYVANTFTPGNYSTFTNSGNFYVYGSNGAISGAFGGGGGSSSLNFGKNISGTLFNNTYTTSGAISATPTIHIFAGTLTANHAITGVNSAFTVDADSTLNANNTLSGIGTFVNNGTTVLGNAATQINLFSSFTNNHTLNVTANSSSTVSITNAGNMLIAANLSMAGQTLTSSGTVTVSGQRTLTAANYTNTGTHASTITNSLTFDKLTCTGCAVTLNTLDLSGSTFSGSIGNDFTILTANSISPPTTTLLPSSSGFFQTLVVQLQNSNTELHVLVSRKPYATLVSPGINTKIARVLDVMSHGTLNSDQTALLAAINLSNNSNELNRAVHTLLPNIGTMIPSLSIQNEAINKVELRVASIRDDYALLPTGINTGDLTPDRTLWMSNFGSITNQAALDESDGYKAKSLGLLLGMDGSFGKNVLGAAFGLSGSRIVEFSNQDHSTHVDRLHGLVYGTHNMPHKNFLDWLATASLNNNRLTRPSTINGTFFSSQAKFRSYNAAFKFTRGKSFDFWDSYRFSPSTYIQYNYINQNAYTETGNPTRLHVADQTKSIVTIGLGTRLNSPLDAWRLIGMRELRAVVSYDVLNNKDVTIANFAAGSDTFSVVSTPARLSLKLGAGLTFAMSKCVEMQFNYDYEIKQRYTDHTGMLKVRYVF